MATSARAFVAIVFGLLAVAFVAETVVLVVEFRDAHWLAFATQDSHTFLFFPTLGILALAAFYLPAAALTDLYWRHERWGKLQFAAVLATVAYLAASVAVGFDASRFRSVWEIKPGALAADTREPVGCGTPDGPVCERMAILEAIGNVEQVSRSRLGLSDFIRSCAADRLMEPPPEPERKRFCFAATPLDERPLLTSTEDCCRAQDRYQERIGALANDGGGRSLTGTVHSLVLPFKVFFLIVLGVISVGLALRHESLSRRYPDCIGRIDAGVVVGAAAMIFFPVMSQAFVETADALYGTAQNEGFKPIVPFMSFGFGAWALLLLLFFYRRHDREVELAGKALGVLASAVAFVKYDLIVALINRFVGSGAGSDAILFLVLLTAAGFVALRTLGRRMPNGQDRTTA